MPASSKEARIQKNIAMLPCATVIGDRTLLIPRGSGDDHEAVRKCDSARAQYGKKPVDPLKRRDSLILPNNENKIPDVCRACLVFAQIFPKITRLIQENS